MAFSLHNHCPCCVLCCVHTQLTTNLEQARQVSLCLKLPVLSYILLKGKFIRQASKQRQRALDPAHRLTHTLSLFVCGLVTSKMFLWLGLNKSCHHSTRHFVGQNAAPHCRIPGKGSELFPPLWISHCQLCELWRPELGSLHSAMSAGAGQSALEPRASFSIPQP